VLIELDGVRLVTDPVLRSRVAHLRRIVPPARDVGTVDAILVSHLHWDHLDTPSLRRFPQSVPVVVPRGSSRLFRRFERVHEVEPGDRVPLGPLEVVATPAEHDGRRGPFGVEAPALGFVVSGSRRMYYAGDTDLFEGMAELGAGGLDLALIPVAGWGAKLGPGHLDAARAAEAARILHPRLAVPVHWGTLRPIHERPNPAVNPAEDFRRLAADLAPDVEVRILTPGETLDLP
jgi:L-ascorbate metabolism protein UlaG (beta-lactamase superfamily)